MQKIIFFCLCLLFVFNFFSCGSKAEVILFAEKYWWNLIEHESDLLTTLEKICTEEGFNFKVIVIEPTENYSQNLKKAAQEPQTKIIVTGAMLLQDVDILAATLPDKQFIVLGSPELYKFSSANVLAVVFDRRSAYYRSGQIVAELLSPDYYYMYETLQNTKVGIIFSLDTEKGREQIGKFQEGFLEKQPDEMLTTEILENSNDRVQAVRAVENLHTQNVKIFLLKNYALVPTSIQKIVSLNAYYIIEDWKFFREFDTNLLFSIEASIPQAFYSALQFVEVSNGEIHPTHFKTISIPCKLFWGNALVLPSILKNEIMRWESNNK